MGFLVNLFGNPKEDEDAEFDAAYLAQWNKRDAELQAGGFGPSRLGPGVPAVTESGPFGTRVWDDSGIEITGQSTGDPGDPGSESPDPYVESDGDYGERY